MSHEPIANAERADAWNNDEGMHWAEHQDRYDALNYESTERLLDAAAISDTAEDAVAFLRGTGVARALLDDADPDSATRARAGSNIWSNERRQIQPDSPGGRRRKSIVTRTRTDRPGPRRTGKSAS